LNLAYVVHGSPVITTLSEDATSQSQAIISKAVCVTFGIFVSSIQFINSLSVAHNHILASISALV
jgi:hypothetical protein